MVSISVIIFRKLGEEKVGGDMGWLEWRNGGGYDHITLYQCMIF